MRSWITTAQRNFFPMILGTMKLVGLKYRSMSFVFLIYFATAKCQRIPFGKRRRGVGESPHSCPSSTKSVRGKFLLRSSAITHAVHCPFPVVSALNASRASMPIRMDPVYLPLLLLCYSLVHGACLLFPPCPQVPRNRGEDSQYRLASCDPWHLHAVVRRGGGRAAEGLDGTRLLYVLRRSPHSPRTSLYARAHRSPSARVFRHPIIAPRHHSLHDRNRDRLSGRHGPVHSHQCLLRLLAG